MRIKESPVGQRGKKGGISSAFNLPQGRNETSFKIIAEGILGPIEWRDFNSGFCVCPGSDLHSTRNGKRDCEIWLGLDDRPPAIHCVHGSCSGVIDEVSRDLRSQLAKAEKTGQRPTREQFLKSRAKAKQREIEKREREKVRAQWKKQLPLILEQNPWTVEQVMQESPVDVRDFWKIGRPPEWAALVDLIFLPGDLVFIGGLRDTGPDHFKTKEEWLKVYQNCLAPKLSQEALFISPWTWKPGTTRKTQENQSERRSLVLESDTLGEQVFPVFKWLKQALRLRAIVYTGGKSFHAWFDPPPPELEKELREAAESLQLDPAMFTNATTRLPGVIRPDTGRNQELAYLDGKEAA